jgi:hypothetical protein
MKSFEHWEFEEVEITFGLRRTKKLPALDTWLGTSMPISEEEKKVVAKLQARLTDNVDSW